MAVNGTGAGGVTPGDVYVGDSGNNRIDEFSATGNFVRAFGYDVVASGGDNTGANEKQSLKVDAEGGTFTVIARRNTLIAPTEGSNVITHVYAPTSAFHVGDVVVNGPFPAGTTITAVGTESLVLSALATVTCNPCEFGAKETTSALPYNTTAGELESALEALPAIGSGNVAVTGSAATAGLAIEYKSALGHNDVFHTSSGARAQDGVTQAISTALTGGVTHTATILNTVKGGGYEICDSSTPSDVCKGGPYCGVGETSVESCQEASAAGSLDEPLGISIDPQNGDLYVIDNATDRVNVYSATGGVYGAFGWNVNASSPKEELQFCSNATGCQSGTSGSGDGQIENERYSSPALGPNGHFYIPNEKHGHRIDEFIPALNGSGEVTGVTFAGALGWGVVANGPDQANEIQKVLVRAGAGKFKLTFKSSTTGELVFDAPAREAEETPGSPESVEKALNALPTISSGGGSVTVTGGPGDVGGSTPYSVTFSGGSLARTDVAEMAATKVGMSGGSPSTTLSVETYSNGTEGLEYCVVARGDACQPGGEGPNVSGGAKLRLGEFSAETPDSVALDQTGSLYAVNQSPNFASRGAARVYKFTFPAPGEAVAEEFAPEYLTQDSGNPSAVDPFGVTVDPLSQHVLVAKMESVDSAKFYEFGSDGALLERSPQQGSGLKAFAQASLTTGASGRFYFGNGAVGVDVFGPPPAPSVSVGPPMSVGSTSATLHGTVIPPTPVGGTGFDTTYHFEYSLDGVEWSRFPSAEVDVGDGSGSGSPNACPANNPPVCAVEQTVTDLIPNSHYLVRLVASTGTVAVSGSEPLTTAQAPPLVSGTAVEDLAETSAELTGFVNPVNEATTYHFEWGTDTRYGNRLPVGADEAAGSGGAAVKVGALLKGLKAGTIYHFRLAATNLSGTTAGPDREFSALDVYGLPDGRVPEQVTANDKRPVGVVAAQLLSGNIEFQASDKGDNIIYPLLNGAVDASAGGYVDYMGGRSETGWTSTQLTPPALVPAVSPGLGGDATGLVSYASADLSCEIIESFEPLTADTPAVDVVNGVSNLYRRNADDSYTLLSAAAPLNEGKGNFTVDWTSADCGHILFETDHRLLEEVPENSTGLYEWVAGTLRLAGVTPDESAPGHESVAVANAGFGTPGGTKKTAWSSMSRDGAKVFFSATSRVGSDTGHMEVFVRENGTTTVEASQSQTATVDARAVYAAASADGSHVFFLANYGLATNGTSTGVNSCTSADAANFGPGCDLYDYDTVTHTLTDLSADTNPADAQGASVPSLFDVSNDGAYVYFAARGQLIPGQGKSEAQNHEGDGTFNVYMSHAGGLSYVGSITDADTEPGQSGSDWSTGFVRWVADATPDGKHLLFVSKANVTGYDSKGVTEAYVYSAEGGETTCVSCRPDGLPSVGDASTEPITIEPAGNINSPQHRARSMSDDGRRVLFTMPDVLAPGARTRSRNVYEWEAGHVYLLAPGEESARDFTRFADMSSSGNDVFVVTKQKMVAQDFDNAFDVYDLRVGGGFPEPGPGAPRCDPLADRCQGEAAPRLLEPLGPASEAFSGPGNPPPTVVQCGNGLASVHGKCVGNKPVAKHKPVSRRCKKGRVRKHGKCVRKASVARARTTTNGGGVAR